MKPTNLREDSNETEATKLQGYGIWTTDIGVTFRCDIQQAISRDDGNELAIDYDRALPGFEPFIATIILRRESPLLFRGTWSVGKAAERETGKCSCRAYSNGSRLALIGAWHEEGGPQQWLAELSPTDDQ